jgi:TBCC domain-containing protein 1
MPQVDEDASKTSTDDAAMQTPILLPASDFHILYVPLVTESREPPEDDSSSGASSQSIYCQLLAQVIQLSPFRLPTEYERQALVKADRMRNLQASIKTLTEEQQARLEEELNRGFRDWLVTSGNLRQVLDLVHLEQSGGV